LLSGVGSNELGRRVLSQVQNQQGPTEHGPNSADGLVMRRDVLLPLMPLYVNGKIQMTDAAVEYNHEPFSFAGLKLKKRRKKQRKKKRKALRYKGDDLTLCHHYTLSHWRMMVMATTLVCCTMDEGFSRCLSADRDGG